MKTVTLMLTTLVACAGFSAAGEARAWQDKADAVHVDQADPAEAAAATATTASTAVTTAAAATTAA